MSNANRRKYRSHNRVHMFNIFLFNILILKCRNDRTISKTDRDSKTLRGKPRTLIIFFFYKIEKQLDRHIIVDPLSKRDKLHLHLHIYVQDLAPMHAPMK